MSDIEEYFKPRPVKSWHKLTDNIIVSKRIHPMFESWLRTRKVMPDNGLFNTPLMGKWHYIYRSPKGRISLIELTDEFHQSYRWEICGGGFTEDVERFATKEEAEVRIKELIG